MRVHRYIRLLELAISVHVLVAIIKKRLKINVSFYTVLQILSLIIFDANSIKSTNYRLGMQSRRARAMITN